MRSGDEGVEEDQPSPEEEEQLVEAEQKAEKKLKLWYSAADAASKHAIELIKQAAVVGGKVTIKLGEKAISLPSDVAEIIEKKTSCGRSGRLYWMLGWYYPPRNLRELDVSGLRQQSLLHGRVADALCFDGIPKGASDIRAYHARYDHWDSCRSNV